MIFKELSKRTEKSINITKLNKKESTVYQYITLPVIGNYTVTVHDIVDGTIITNPSVNPQVLEYVKLPLPTQTIVHISKLHLIKYVLFYDVLLGTTSNDMTVIDVTSTTHVTVTSMPNPSHVSILIITLPASISGLLVLVIVVLVLAVLVCIIVRRRKCGNASITDKTTETQQ